MAEWDTAYINNLKDEAFAYIEPGGRKDETGRITPRSLRHLPYKDSDGKVDLPHLRNALARVTHTSLPESTQNRIKAKLEAIGSKHDVGEGVEKIGWTDEARAAAAEARRAIQASPNAHKVFTHGMRGDGTLSSEWPVAPENSQNLMTTSAPYHKVLSARGWNPVSHIPGAIHYGHPKYPSHALTVHDNGTWVHSEQADPVMKPSFRSRGIDPKTLQNHLRSTFPEKSEFMKAEPGSKVQSLIFDKSKYETAEDAKAWASDHGFSAEKVDETGDSFRIRQHDPGQFTRIRTMELTTGVQATIGVPKKTVKALQQTFAESMALKKIVLTGPVEVEGVRDYDHYTIYKISVGARYAYFAEGDGAAIHLPNYFEEEIEANVRKSVILKAVSEQRYTLGLVYPAKEVDFHGDTMSTEELEKSAWSVMSKGGVKIGLMHRPGTAGAGTAVESYIYRGPVWKMKDVSGEEQTIDPGDWLMGVVWNEEGWQAVKSGEIKGYSLQGIARKDAIL